MTSKYQDSETMWHNRECIDGKPRSNNTWIYSAYAKYLAPGTVKSSQTRTRFHFCVKSYLPLTVDRLPGMPEPAMSKDEIVGMVSLGYLNNLELEQNHYNFCNINSEFDRKLTLKSFVKAVKGLLKVRQEVKQKGLTGSRARNYLWENNRVETYPLAFRLPPQDIYYVKRMAGEKTTLLEKVMFYGSFINAKYFSKNKSSRMMLWLQLEDLDHFLKRFIPKKRWVRTYFTEEHDFYKGLE